MTRNGQGPSPRHGGGEPPRRRFPEGDAPRRHAGSQWSVLATASRLDRGAAEAARPHRDESGVDFVRQAIQRVFQ